MKTTVCLAVALAATLLATGCSASSNTAQNQTGSQTQADTADAGMFNGDKNRVPMYDSHLTSKPQAVVPGMYQYETSDAPADVFAWYKTHVPSTITGTWNEPDPDAAPRWGFHGNVPDGRLDIEIQPVNKSYLGYAAGTKSIVAVIDK